MNVLSTKQQCSVDGTMSFIRPKRVEFYTCAHSSEFPYSIPYPIGLNAVNVMIAGNHFLMLATDETFELGAFWLKLKVILGDVVVNCHANLG